MKNKDFFLPSFLIVFMWMVYTAIRGLLVAYKSPDLLNFVIFFIPYQFVFSSMFTIFLFYLFKKYFYAKSLNKKRASVLVFGLLISASFLELFDMVFIYFYFQKFGFDLQVFILKGGLHLFNLLPFLGLFFVLKFLKERDEEKFKAKEAINLAIEAKLEMLSYQLNPHFLFNALNTIMALIDHDKDEAREIITDLSDYLRYSLNNSKKKEVTLEEEYNSVLDYLKIQKKRFREKIEIKTELDERIKRKKVPVFIIHPIVENAVKHGTKTCKEILKISLSIKQDENNIIVEVKNGGKLVNNRESQNIGTGTGLSNTIKRIGLLYGKGYGVELNEKDGVVTCLMKLGEL